MAGTSELENFVRKFIFLWKSGCNAKLSVEAKAGEAFVNLSVGLGQAVPVVPARRRGGAAARQRRTERRAAERLSSAKVEENSNVKNENTDDQFTSENKFGQTHSTCTSLPNPEIEGTAEEAAQATFDVMVEAHDKCKNDDVIEALEENFFGNLKDKKIEKSDPRGYFNIREAAKEVLDVQKVYRIKVRNEEVITDIVERWKKPYEFDDLAFTNAVHGEVAIKIKDVKRVR